MAKKKGSKSGSGNGVAALAQKLDRLSSQIAGQKGTGKKKKNRKKKSGQARINQLAKTWSLRSDYARAVLDPFNVRGARVPDSHMLRTGVSWVRSTVNSGKQNFNFDPMERYIYVNSAPLYMAAGKSLVVAGVQPASFGVAPDNFFKLGAANTFNVGNFTTVGATNYDAEGGLFNSYRVSGGGTRMTFTGATEDSNILVYAVPSFNGDPWLTNYLDVVSYATRTWTISKAKETITVPFPLRSTSSAYNWVKLGSHPGGEIDDYPDEDGPFPQTALRSAYVAPLSTDSSATNGAISAWSFASGMGGFQIGVKIPPGCSYSVEQIIHVEYTAPYSNSLGKGTLADEAFDICLSNSAEVEAVGNAVAAVSQSTHDSHAGSSSVMDDLRHLRDEIGSQTAQGAADALADTQILREMVGVGVLAAAGGVRALNRRHFALGR